MYKLSVYVCSTLCMCVVLRVCVCACESGTVYVSGTVCVCVVLTAGLSSEHRL